MISRKSSVVAKNATVQRRLLNKFAQEEGDTYENIRSYYRKV